MTLLNSLFSFLLLVVGAEVNIVRVASEEQFNPNYADALDKSILFFEGQRSGRLPNSQRMKWRKHSALDDGHDVQLDLTGGYYDAGDNVKFNFPMAFSTTMLSWSVIEFVNSEKTKGLQLAHAQNAIRWATDYFLKCTRIPDKVFVQIGDPYSDHTCWERPEDMDTNRTTYAVDKDHPGSEVSAEIAAALASASIVYRNSTDHAPNYSKLLLERAIQVFNFADKYRGNYNDSLGSVVCPFYCDWSGYQDELVWAAAWLYKATKATVYWEYVVKNVGKLPLQEYESRKNAEFGWDDKHAGISVLIANELLSSNASDTDVFRRLADKFVCTILPESPTLGVNYSKGGLIFKEGGSNMQRPAAISFLLVAYSRYLARANQVVQCGDHKTATPDRLISIAKGQVDYILGNNPLKMSYMVGYGNKYPQKIHHRGSTLPSIDEHPEKLGCHDGTPYFESQNPNPNVLVGAVVGGPFPNDTYVDSRYLFKQSEPTTYINAPLVGVFAYLYSASDVI